MISFINTELFVDGSTIHVIVYSEDRDKAIRKIKSLISGEDIKLEKESRNDYLAVVSKGNIDIVFSAKPFTAHLIGHRSQFAIIDKCMVAHDMCKELFFTSIRPITLMYPHLLKNPKEGNEIMQFMLF